jgi:SAM-dependent methyltransferase
VDLMTTVRQAWDAMMEHYLPGRSDLVLAAGDEAERVLGRLPASVLDLGGGPGTTVEAVLRRWPATRATLLDIDPVLLALARRALPASVAICSADLTTPHWTASVGRHDVVLAVMTLHYFPESRVRQLYREIREVLAPNGVLLVVDRLSTDAPTPAGRPQADDPPGGDPWTRWWSDLAADQPLRPLLAERAAIMSRLESAEFVAPTDWHFSAARAAGYAGARLVCRRGDHALLAMIA